MNLNLTPCAFPAELAKGTTAQSVQATYHVSIFAMITSFFNSILVAVNRRRLELLARPLHGVAVHEKRVAVVSLHRPDERLGPHLVSAVANPEVGHGIGVHRSGDARGSTAGAAARVTARGGGDEAVRDAEHAHRRGLGRGRQSLCPRRRWSERARQTTISQILKNTSAFCVPHVHGATLKPKLAIFSAHSQTHAGVFCPNVPHTPFTTSALCAMLHGRTSRGTPDPSTKAYTVDDAFVLAIDLLLPLHVPRRLDIHGGRV